MSSQTLNAVLFDLDGTLLDTAPDFYQVLNRLCDQHQQPCPSFEQLRSVVSHGSDAMVGLAFKIKPENAQFSTLKQQFLSLYQHQLAEQSQLFAGIEKLLAWLEERKTPWGIVTNKPKRYTDAILSALQLHKRCAVVICPEDVTHSKPDPESLLLASQKINTQASQCIYIGDHRRDIEAGIRAGMPTIAVGYGYTDANDPPDTWGADYFVAESHELLTLIQRLSHH